MNKRVGFLRDEQGNLSGARLMLAGSLLYTLVMVVLDSLKVITIPGPAYVLLGTIFTGLLAWAAGPRIAQYVGPQAGAIAQGIAAAVSKTDTMVAPPEVLDSDLDFRDDEE